MTLLAVVGRPDPVEPVAADDPWRPFLEYWAQRWGSDFRRVDPFTLTAEQRKSLGDALQRFGPCVQDADKVPDAGALGVRLSALDRRCRQYVEERFYSRWRRGCGSPGDWSTAQRRDLTRWAGRAETLAARVDALKERGTA